MPDRQIDQERFEYGPHRFAKLFPEMTEREFDELVADIKARGLREPIVIYDGEILDGCNRARACKTAGVEPTFAYPAFRGDKQEQDAQALHFVVSRNLRRRHLNAPQRSFIAVEIANMRQGERTDLQPPAPVSVAQPSAPVPKVSQAKAASMLGVSPRSVVNAKAVLDHGSPQLVAAAKADQVSLREAAATAREAKPRTPKQVIAGLAVRIAAGELSVEDAHQEGQALPIPPTMEMLAEVSRLARKKQSKREARLSRKAPREARDAVKALNEAEQDKLLAEFNRLKHVLAFRLHALDSERRAIAGEFFNSIAVDAERWLHWAVVRSWADTQQRLSAQEDDERERRSLQ